MGGKPGDYSRAVMSALESQAPPDVDVEAFREQGYVLVKGLLSADEVEELRADVDEVMEGKARDGHVLTATGLAGTLTVALGDLLSDPVLRRVMLDERLLGRIRQVLGGDPVYFGDSSVRRGTSGTSWSWHRDNVDHEEMVGPDWRDPYPIVRCGIYLQDHSRHSGGLGVRPYSHRLPGEQREDHAVYVPTEPGDLVIWNLRILHTGEVLRYRPFTSKVVPPRFMGPLNRLGLLVPEERERKALFMSFGRPSDHLDRFVDYLSRQDWTTRSWAAAQLDDEARRGASEAGLVIREVPGHFG
jgi:hypothetical protein